MPCETLLPDLTVNAHRFSIKHKIVCSAQAEQQAGGVDSKTGMTRAGHLPGQLTWANNTAVDVCQQTVI